MHSGQKIRALIMSFWALIGLILFTASSQSVWSCQYVDHHSQTPPVILYTTSWCPYCHKALQFFDNIKVSYTNCDVERSPQGREQFNQLGGTSVPLIMIGNQKFEGFQPSILQQSLNDYENNPSS